MKTPKRLLKKKCYSETVLQIHSFFLFLEMPSPHTHRAYCKTGMICASTPRVNTMKPGSTRHDN